MSNDCRKRKATTTTTTTTATTRTSESENHEDAMLLERFHSLTVLLEQRDSTLTVFEPVPAEIIDDSDSDQEQQQQQQRPTVVINSNNKRQRRRRCRRRSSLQLGWNHVLEQEEGQEALQLLLRACERYTDNSIRRVVFRSLAGPDLSSAIRSVAHWRNLKQLIVQDCPSSQCIPLRDIVYVLETLVETDVEQQQQEEEEEETPITVEGSGESILTSTSSSFSSRNSNLEHLHITTRIELKTQQQLDELSAAMELHKHQLQHVHLNLLPRCSIEHPTVNLNSLLLVLAACPKLKHLEITLGYHHNPFGQPMISVQTLQTLISSQTIQSLELYNFGLNDTHLFMLAQSIKQQKKTTDNNTNNNTNSSSNSSSSSLCRLYLSRNRDAAFTCASLQAITDALKDWETNNDVSYFSNLSDFQLWTADQLSQQERFLKTVQNHHRPCAYQRAREFYRLHFQMQFYLRLDQLSKEYQLYNNKNNNNNNNNNNKRKAGSSSSNRRGNDDDLSSWWRAILSLSSSDLGSDEETNENTNDEKRDSEEEETQDLSIIYTLLRRNPIMISASSIRTWDDNNHKKSSTAPTAKKSIMETEKTNRQREKLPGQLSIDKQDNGRINAPPNRSVAAIGTLGEEKGKQLSLSAASERHADEVAQGSSQIDALDVPGKKKRSYDSC